MEATFNSPYASTIRGDCAAEPTEQDPQDPQGFWTSTGDAYFAHALPSLTLSPDAQQVMNLLTALWIKSLPYRESYAASKPDLHLCTWDAGVYQLKHLFRDVFPDDWAELRAAHKSLTTRLQEGVYTFGFLKKTTPTP